MKKVILILSMVLALSFIACSDANDRGTQTHESNKKVFPSTQLITEQNIVGEWKCVDITNETTHMRNIAQMQAHIIFDTDKNVLNKMKLPDGSFVKQKVGTYGIKNGKVVSTLYDANPYMQNNQLIFEDSSSDDKRIYEKVR